MRHFIRKMRMFGIDMWKVIKRKLKEQREEEDVGLRSPL